MAQRIVIVWTTTFTAIMSLHAVVDANGKRWPGIVCLFYFCTLLHVLWSGIHAAATYLFNLG